MVSHAHRNNIAGRAAMVSAAVRSLRHRNYRLFFMGQGISLVGTWMQGVALPWLVYDISGSVVLLGVVGFTGQILTFALAPVAGVLADRWNRRRLVAWAQVLSLVQAMGLAVLTLAGVIEVWHIIALSLFGGLIRAFEIPIRQSFVIEMIDDRRDLANAIALNSFLVNSSRLVGPSIAGLIIGRSGAAWQFILGTAGASHVVGPAVADWLTSRPGEAWVFLLNAVSYIAVIAALAAMRLVPRRIEPARSNMLAGLAEGFRYVWRHPAIRPVLALLVLVSLTGVPYQTLMPVFAREVLGGGPETMGFLMAAVGVGAIIGALMLALRQRPAGMGRIIMIAAAVFGASLMLFAASGAFWLSMLILVCVGGGMMMQMATSNTLLQTVVDEDKRGRVMSFYTMAFMGMGPFGSLMAGTLAAQVGVQWTVAIGGAACILGAAAFGLLALKKVEAELVCVRPPQGQVVAQAAPADTTEPRA